MKSTEPVSHCRPLLLLLSWSGSPTWFEALGVCLVSFRSLPRPPSFSGLSALARALGINSSLSPCKGPRWWQNIESSHFLYNHCQVLRLVVDGNDQNSPTQRKGLPLGPVYWSSRLEWGPGSGSWRLLPLPSLLLSFAHSASVQGAGVGGGQVFRRMLTWQPSAGHSRGAQRWDCLITFQSLH